jgi:toxin ParE1/3/4
MKTRRWRIRYTQPARRDFHRIRAYTVVNFGVVQETAYKDLMYTALRKLQDGPTPIGSKSHEDILPNLHSLDITLGGKRGRHVIYYRVGHDDVIEVMRILHDASDMSRHFPDLAED